MYIASFVIRVSRVEPLSSLLVIYLYVIVISVDHIVFKSNKEINPKIVTN